MTYDAFSLHTFQVAFGNVVALSTVNKPIHCLQLFQCETVSLVLLTHANTLDWSRHFELGHSLIDVTTVTFDSDVDTVLL